MSIRHHHIHQDITAAGLPVRKEVCGSHGTVRRYLDEIFSFSTYISISVTLPSLRKHHMEIEVFDIPPTAESHGLHLTILSTAPRLWHLPANHLRIRKTRGLGAA